MGISASQERYVNFYTDFAFKKLFGTEISKDELYDYRESQKDFWDLNSVLETAERKGIEKGDRKRQISTAKSLKAMGVLTDAQIAEATGLSEDEVREA